MSIPIQQLLPHLPVWVLVLFRLTGLFVLAPVLGSVAIPARIRILWAVALSLCVYPVLLGRPGAAALVTPLVGHEFSLWTLPVAVAMELLIGLLIGYGANLAMMALQVAGHVADQQVGLGLASIFNPELNDQTGVIGEFYFIMGMMIFIILGGDRMMVATLLHSFDSVPLGGYRPDGQMLDLMLGLLTSMMELAIRIAAPLLCLIFLETVAMGFIARTVPQMNILSFGFPLRILIGVGVLVASISNHAQVFITTMRDHLHALSVAFG